MTEDELELMMKNITENSHEPVECFIDIIDIFVREYICAKNEIERLKYELQRYDSHPWEEK